MWSTTNHVASKMTHKHQQIIYLCRANLLPLFQGYFFHHQSVGHDVGHEQPKRGQKHQHAGEAGVGRWMNDAQQHPGQGATRHPDEHVGFAALAIDGQGVGSKRVEQFQRPRNLYNDVQYETLIGGRKV